MLQFLIIYVTSTLLDANKLFGFFPTVNVRMYLQLLSCEQSFHFFPFLNTGVKSVHVDLNKDQVVVESSLTSSQVQSLIEKTGKRAVLQGYGGFNGKNNPHLL